MILKIIVIFLPRLEQELRSYVDKCKALKKSLTDSTSKNTVECEKYKRKISDLQAQSIATQEQVIRMLTL